MSDNYQITKAVIPVAGLGAKIFPVTRAFRKGMLPVLDRDGVLRPVIQTVVAEALLSGVEEVALVLRSSDMPDFRDYFSKGLPEEYEKAAERHPELAAEYDKIIKMGRRIEYIEQPTLDGYGHAVYCARDWVDNHPFLLLLGDHLFIEAPHQARCGKQMINLAPKFGTFISAVSFIVQDAIPFTATIKAIPVKDRRSVYKIEEIVEKPSIQYVQTHHRVPGAAEDEYLGIFGQHILPPEIFDCLEHHIKNNITFQGEIQLTTSLEMLRKDGVPYYAKVIRGARYDVGTPCDFGDTIAAMAARFLNH